jgi:signal peptidase I
MNCSSIEFIELSNDILTKGSYLRFQAKGNSMFPAIKNGDILNIEPIKDKDLQWADVLFYRAAGRRMVAHRLIKKYFQDKKLILITRGDYTVVNDAKVSLDDVLGRVKAIERSGRTIGLNSGIGRINNLFFAGISPLVIKLREVAGKLLRAIQGLKAYRKIAKKLIKEKILYQIGPFESSGNYLLAKVDNRVVGKVRIDSFKEGDSLYPGWWISGIWISWRYRGLGVAERLTKMIFDLAKNQGAYDIKLLVFNDNKAAINLYKKMGFQQIAIQKIDEELKRQAEMTKRQRIVMMKHL